AGLYDVQTKVLVQAVKRNQIRFPSDFMFQLTRQDVTNLKSQFVTSSLGDRRTWVGVAKP
ncbi:MAG TPA: ORF6N domain-containing protein, partial [Burkholderiales bacterium]